jgi:hypothetical protein
MKLLSALAAMSIIAGTVYVAAEGAGQAPAPPGTTEPKTGAPPKGGEPKAKPDPKGKQAQPKGEDKQPKGKDPKAKDAPPKGEPKPKEAPPKAGAKPKPDDPKTADPKAKDGAPPKTGEKAPKGDGKSVTPQQRTEIRQVIVKSGKAPRVTNVNFTISVGAVVPRTVQVVVLPPRVVEIYPAWRGYRYFLVGDRIIIVDGAYRIVFIIDA